MSFDLYPGDCLATLCLLDDNSVDAIVTDPPYGLAFMGKKWDYDVPSEAIWRECLRVLKPGGHLLAFAGTRTQHRMAVRIEDAGFEIRDMIAWVYGSGFPKSLDVSKAIDKAAGAEREKVLVPTKAGNTRGERGISYAGESFSGFTDISEPVTDAARQWQGWGTALKPALEPITVARKPLVAQAWSGGLQGAFEPGHVCSVIPGPVTERAKVCRCGAKQIWRDSTVAANVLEHGTGALNIDGCRVSMSADDAAYIAERIGGFNATKSIGGNGAYSGGKTMDRAAAYDATQGRWPANLIHDGSEEVVGSFGDPARFFYCAKASKRDRGEGNAHPTVKPTELMRYLCRLVTPPGGLVLDPFMGSGSTGKAAILEGFRFIGCEMSPEYLAIAKARIAAAHLEGLV